MRNRALVLAIVSVVGIGVTTPSGVEAKPPRVRVLATGGTIAGAQASATDYGYKSGAYDVNTLLAADEVFVTNSIMTIMPVCRLERKAVGDEKPGTVTRRLAAEFEAMVRKECRLS